MIIIEWVDSIRIPLLQLWKQIIVKWHFNYQIKVNKNKSIMVVTQNKIHILVLSYMEYRCRNVLLKVYDTIFI